MVTAKSPLIIENIQPSIDGGKYPVKREVGDSLTVSATIFRDGHDIVNVVLKYKEKYGEDEWHETKMTLTNPGLDYWEGSFELKKNTTYIYTVEACTDIYQSWLADTTKKYNAGQDITSELMEGEVLFNDVIHIVSERSEKEYLKGLLMKIESTETQQNKLKMFSFNELLSIMKTSCKRHDTSSHEPFLEVVVDRVRARYAAWYEMFPRSQGREPGKSGTFEDCTNRLTEIKSMGFNVVYFPPIHPIGITKRKGPNNSLEAGPDDPGSPYAIGSKDGGHMAVDPGLGTIEDFEEFEKSCRAKGMEVALDFAINCSPDHPYVKEHPEWFFKRPDGTIKYAENPPKKYEDIYPLNFSASNPNYEGLCDEMKKVLLFWIDKGVRIFRVDNPHTKPVPFWEWLIAELRRDCPDVVFLAEAFTRPPMTKMLAKVGFTQSYTYFTWRNFKQELTDYFTELTQSNMKEYFRGNLFANTPDILPQILQEGGRPAFKIRFVLAATLSSVYGIYSGYELCENRAIQGKEEYLDSEKYEFKVWDWDRKGNIKDFITKVNKIRADNPALHLYKNLQFYKSDNDNILFYGKATEDKSNIILIVVNLDPFKEHKSNIYIPLRNYNISMDESYELHNLITGEKAFCKGEMTSVTLDPKVEPAHIYTIKKWSHKESDFDYFGM